MSELHSESLDSAVPDEVWDNLNLETGEIDKPEGGSQQVEAVEDDQPGREPESASPEEEPEQPDEDGSPGEDELPGDMYAAELLKFDDGTSMTVEQAKDAVREYRGREAEMEQNRTELIRDMAQVNQILANGGPLNEQQVQELNVYRANHLAQQHEVMMRAHPEWKDQARMQQDKLDMIEVARRYGKSQEAVAGIQNAMDLQMLYDLTRLVKEREKASAVLKEKRSPKQTTQGRKPAPRRRSNTNNLGKTLDAFKGQGENANWGELDNLLR